MHSISDASSSAGMLLLLLLASPASYEDRSWDDRAPSHELAA